MRMRIRTQNPTHITTAETGSRSAGDVGAESQLLRLLHLASPALPVGAFHFSQGLEYAVEAGWVHDEASARQWIGGLTEAALAGLDLPLLHRLRAAWVAQDHAAVLRWNGFLIACRETGELRAEDRHLGAALLRVLAELELETDLFPARAPPDEVGVAHATAFAFACASWGIAPLATLQTYAWAWVENQVLAAVKLVPLGQSAGQRLLHELNQRLVAITPRAIDVMDSDIGVCTAMQTVASARHETQYTRLFRS